MKSILLRPSGIFVLWYMYVICLFLDICMECLFRYMYVFLFTINLIMFVRGGEWEGGWAEVYVGARCLTTWCKIIYFTRWSVVTRRGTCSRWVWYHNWFHFGPWPSTELTDTSHYAHTFEKRSCGLGWTSFVVQRTAGLTRRAPTK